MASDYDEAFEQHLLDQGIRSHIYRTPTKARQRPDNWEEIQNRLARTRRSLSPENFTFDSFLDFDATSYEAENEAKTMHSMVPVITGDSVDIPHGERLSFNNLEDLTDGSIAKAKFVFFDGSDPFTLQADIREGMESYIMPVKMGEGDPVPCLPNFFMEAQGADGRVVVGQRLALYHGVLGARGVHRVREWVDPASAHDNRAYTITSIYRNDHESAVLSLFTVHPIRIHYSLTGPSATETVEWAEGIGYRLCLLGRWELLESWSVFLEGVGALKNARE